MKSFLDIYLDYTKPIKGSKLFHTWSCIALVSATLERRCYWRIFDDQLYPNLYVILVGKPGVGKSFTANIAMKFLDRLNEKYKNDGIHKTTDKITPASLVRQLSRATKTLSGEKYHALYSYASEMSSFAVDIGGGSLSNDLLKLYDCEGSFSKEIVKENESHYIEKPCFGFLWCTTPSFIRRFMPHEAAGEGFGSRILFVTDNSPIDRDWVTPVPDASLKKAIFNRLEKLLRMKGAFSESPECVTFFEEWQPRWLDKLNKLPAHGNYGNFFSRKEINAKKVSMILAACRGSLQVELEDAKRALALMDEIDSGAIEAMGLDDISKHQDFNSILMSYITADGITEGELVKQLEQDGLTVSANWQWEAFRKLMDIRDDVKVKVLESGKRAYWKR